MILNAHSFYSILSSNHKLSVSADEHWAFGALDSSRFRAASNARLNHLSFEGD